MPDSKPDKQKSVTGLIAAGFFIVLPVFLAGLLIGTAYDTLQGMLQPLLDVLPGVIFRDPRVRGLAVIMVIVLMLLLVGLLASTTAARVIGRRLEAGFLNHLPFYTLLRNFASGLAGKDDASALRPVLVTVDVPGLQQLGFLLERHADGSGTVFLPSSPNPGSGTVVIAEAARLRELPVPAHRVFSCLSRWGSGTGKLLELDPVPSPHNEKQAR